MPNILLDQSLNLVFLGFADYAFQQQHQLKNAIPVNLSVPRLKCYGVLLYYFYGLLYYALYVML